MCILTAQLTAPRRRGEVSLSDGAAPSERFLLFSKQKSKLNLLKFLFKAARGSPPSKILPRAPNGRSAQRWRLLILAPLRHPRGWEELLLLVDAPSRQCLSTASRKSLFHGDGAGEHLSSPGHASHGNLFPPTTFFHAPISSLCFTHLLSCIIRSRCNPFQIILLQRSPHPSSS